MLRVYVENQAGRDPAYGISETIFRAAMPLPPSSIELTVCSSDAPDLAALACADVFVGSGFDTARIRDHAPQLRLVHCTSAGVEKYLPLDWLPDGARLTNSSGIHATKAAEYAAMALLMLNTQFPLLRDSQQQRRWTPRLTDSIAGKRLLLVGLGQLGAAVAGAGRRLGLRVEALTRHGRPDAAVDEVFRIDQLRERLPFADYLVLCCPLTAETRGLIDADALALLKPGAGLVNLARGPVVVTAALLEALRSGQLGGAVLDVFDTEPLPADSPLWDAPNVVITPHVSCDIPSGYTSKSLEILARNIDRMLAGDTALENVVSVELGY